MNNVGSVIDILKHNIIANKKSEKKKLIVRIAVPPAES